MWLLEHQHKTLNWFWILEGEIKMKGRKKVEKSKHFLPLCISADLWVPGSQCAATICPLAKFGETKSSTFNVTTQPFNITYGIGDASGVYATDTVTIAGATVQQQKFGYVTNTKNILTEMTTLSGQTYTPTVSSADNATTYANDYRMDGIFGLGYRNVF